MSTTRELKDLLAMLGIHPSRRLGQNFLVDSNLLDAMLRDADPRPGQRVLEVGPGTGILTRRLLAAGCIVTAVELDHRLAAHLREALADAPGFRLIEGDACRTDYAALFGSMPFRCIANLPYACSSVFLATLATLENAPVDLFVLLQREMADRLTAEPGSADYGALTVRVQLRYTARTVRAVPPQVFWPPPEVASAFVRLERRSEPYRPAVRELAGELAGIAFSQRRKKAGGVLCERLGGATAAHLTFQAAGLSPDARAEQFSPTDFARLAACLLGQ